MRKGALILLLFLSLSSPAQQRVHVEVLDSMTSASLGSTEILDDKGTLISLTNTDGVAFLDLGESPQIFVFQKEGYISQRISSSEMQGEYYKLSLTPTEYRLSEALVSSTKIIQNLSQSQIQSTSLIRSDRSASFLPGTQTAQDLVQNLASTMASHDPLTGNSVGVSGLSGSNVQLLLDGQPVTGRMNGNIDLSQFSLADVKEVQVYYGPQSIIYGSDASGGLINLVSFGDDTAKFGASIQSYFETVRKYNFDASVNFSVAKNRFSMDLGRYYFDGQKLYDTLLRKFTWLPKEQYFGNLKWTHHWNWGKRSLRLRASADHYREHLYDPGEPIISHTQHTATSYDNMYQTDRNQISASLFYWNQNWNHSLQNTFSDFARRRYTYFMDLVEDTKTPTTNSGALSDYFSLWQTRYIAQRKTERLSWQLGTDLNSQSGKGSKISGIQHQSELGLFAISDIGFKQWHISPGFRYNLYSRFKNQWLPAIQVSHKINSRFFLELGYAKAYRVPSLKEYYLDFVDVNHNIKGNTSLLPELTHSFNAGFRYTFLRPSAIWKTKITSTYYDISDLIQLTSIDGLTNTFTYNNIGHVKNTSSIWDLEFKPDITGHILSLKSTLNWIHYLKYGNIQNQDAYNQTFMLKWQHPNTRLGFNMNSKTTIGQQVFVMDIDKIIARQLQNYTLLNFGINKSFLGERISVEFGIKNLLNIQQIDYVDGSGSVGIQGGVHGSTGSGMLTSPGRSLYTRFYWKF